MRLISANEWGVTTEFWHFDFSAYLNHGRYGIMGSYGTFMHYASKKKKKKNPIGVIRPKIRVKNEILRFLKFLSSSKVGGTELKGRMKNIDFFFCDILFDSDHICASPCGHGRSKITFTVK